LIWLGFDPSVQMFRNWELLTALPPRSAYFSIMQQLIRVVIKLEPVELVRSELVNLSRATSGSINVRSLTKSDEVTDTTCVAREARLLYGQCTSQGNRN
jgi:hypothetical protein